MKVGKPLECGYKFVVARSFVIWEPKSTGHRTLEMIPNIVRKLFLPLPAAWFAISSRVFLVNFVQKEQFVVIIQLHQMTNLQALTKALNQSV